MTDSAQTAPTDDLQPTSVTGRVFSTLSYVLMWWSSLIVMQAFVLGQAFLPPNGKLNLLQALVIMTLAGVLFVLALALNGQAGLKYGIPYSIQVRTGFGLRGSTIVEFLRALPAIIWCGIGTWIAALSLDAILTTLGGYTSPAMRYVYFVLLQAIQTALAYRGIRAMKWFNVAGSVVIAAGMGYMLVHIVSTYGIKITASWRSEGTWGAPFWIALTSAIGVLATVMLNISDMTRHLENSQRANWIGHLAGVIPPWFFMLMLGILSGAALGIWDPVQALMQLSPNPLALVVLLVFVLVAQFTTNLTINILPPALIFMNTFGMTWRQGVVLSGALGVASCPWLLMANSDAFFGFILYYSALFGPILGVMLADYWVVRRRRLDVQTLYVTGESSEYWYRGGFNMAGLVAVFLPGVLTMIWCLPVAWLVGVPVAFVLYLALHPLINSSEVRVKRPHAGGP
jgi:NCS1 family nucleobase:cation symporter-1